jgi:hypothetical protein
LRRSAAAPLRATCPVSSRYAVSASSSGRRAFEHQQLRPQHECPRDCEHLLLAAREGPRLLRPPFGEPREVAVHASHVVLDRLAVAPRDRTDTQILFRRQHREGPAAVRHVGEPQPHDVLGDAALDGLACEAHLAAAAHEPAHRAEQGRLTGAVGTQDRGDAAFRHREADAAQDIRRTVAGMQILDLEQGAHGARA